MVLVAIALFVPSCVNEPRISTVASGLDQPRGMAFDAGGNLVVAEAGAAGAVIQPPVTTNTSGRVSRITPDGRRETVIGGLPFTLDTATGTSVGPADVALVGGELLVLTGEGSALLSRSLLRIEPGAPPQMVASFLAFAQAGNPEGQMMGGAGVQANPYAMIAAPDGSALFVSDGASGRVLRVTLDGTIQEFAAVPGRPPLTGLAFGPDGRLYVAVFSVLPHTPGSGAIWVAEPGGAIAPAVEGLTMPIDVAFDPAGTLYVLEFSDGRSPKEPYAAGRGRLLRIEAGGEHTVVLDGLNFPTAMLFARSGDLLISASGAFSGAGAGSVVRVACAELGVGVCRAEP